MANIKLFRRKNDNQAIKYEIIENIGIIKGTNPPVNALSYDVRKGLIDTLNLFLKMKILKE